MPSKGKEIRIIALLFLDTIFFLLELVIGYWTHSLALIADAFHMLNDILSLMVALWAVNVAKNRNPDAKYTYGWKRAEILGALVNAVFLIALCFSILLEALQRLISPPIIDNPQMICYVGIAGFVSNIMGLFLFHDHGHGHSHGHSHTHSHSHDHTQSQLEAGQNINDTESNNISNNISGQTDSDSPGYYDDDSPVEISISNTENIREIMPQSIVNKLDSETTGLLKKQQHPHAMSIGNNKNLNIDGSNKSNTIATNAYTSLASQTDAKRPKPTHQRSLNMNGVFLHVMGDALGNIGVIIAALFIWETNYSWRYYVDPLVSIVITIIIFSSALPLARRASKILLQATPSTLSADDIQRSILAIPSVVAVHDFHIWNLTESIYIASLHVQVDCTPNKFLSTAKQIREVFHKYGVHSATVQPEFISGEISSDARNRFSRIAGGCETGDDLTGVSCSSTDHEAGRCASPAAYGAITPRSNCMVDDAANCNPATCL